MCFSESWHSLYFCKEENLNFLDLGNPKSLKFHSRVNRKVTYDQNYIFKGLIFFRMPELEYNWLFVGLGFFEVVFQFNCTF